MCIFRFIIPLYFLCENFHINYFLYPENLPCFIKKSKDISIFSLQIYLFLLQDGRPRYIIEQFLSYSWPQSYTTAIIKVYFEPDNVLFLL